MTNHQIEIPDDLQVGEMVIVSSCLLGENTAWHGGNELCKDLVAALAAAGAKVISVCPEVLGGLSTPRSPAEPESGGGHEVLAGTAQIKIVGDGPDCGQDVSAQFFAGAQAALRIAQEHNARYAFLAERSPSCGVAETHSGGKVIKAPGTAAAHLSQGGVTVFGIH